LRVNSIFGMKPSFEPNNNWRMVCEVESIRRVSQCYNAERRVAGSRHETLINFDKTARDD